MKECNRIILIFFNQNLHILKIKVPIGLVYHHKSNKDKIEYFKTILNNDTFEIIDLVSIESIESNFKEVKTSNLIQIFSTII